MQHTNQAWDITYDTNCCCVTRNCTGPLHHTVPLNEVLPKQRMTRWWIDYHDLMAQKISVCHIIDWFAINFKIAAYCIAPITWINSNAYSKCVIISMSFNITAAVSFERSPNTVYHSNGFLMSCFLSFSLQDLRKAGLLVFANKQDVKGCMSVAEISQSLQLTSVKDHQWHIQACCALTGEGWETGLILSLIYLCIKKQIITRKCRFSWLFFLVDESDNIMV